MIKTDEELWEILGNVDKFNSYISSIVEQTKREMILLVPEIVIKHIQDQHKYKKVVDKFYSDNPEFRKDKVLIGQLMNKIAADNPGLEISEVFKRTAIKAKKVLGEKDYEKRI